MLYNRFLRKSQQNLANRLQLLFISVLLGAVGVWFFSRVLEVEAANVWGASVGLLALAIGLLPRASSLPWLTPLHVLLTVHFSVFSRIFFRADDLDKARAMVQKLLEFDSLGVREGMFRIQGFSAWLKPRSSWTFLDPLAEWGLLIVLLGGFVVHYLPTQKLEHSILRQSLRVPGLLVGVGFALLLGLFGLLLSGPRANIYFAF
jgi:uncharacterized membrane protein YsdA (DUF1294 family)